MTTGGPSPRWLFAGILIAVVIWAVTAVTFLPQRVPDSDQYIRLAESKRTEVPAPFANRVLQPAIVRAVHLATGIPLESAFYAVAVAGLLLFCICVAWMVRAHGPLAAAGVLMLPFLAGTFRPPFLGGFFPQVFLADMVHAALVALFLVLISRRFWFAAIMVLFALQLTRETSLLLGFIAAALAWRDGSRRFAVGAVAAGLLGVAVASFFARGAAPNPHGLETFVYLMLKAPFDTAHNLGIELWSNTLPNPAGSPAWTIAVPSWLPSGGMTTVGFVGFDALPMLRTLAGVVTLFGVIPGFMAGSGLGGLWRMSSDHDLAIRIALWYGLAAFLIAPISGAAVWRLLAYGWPAFVVAVPPMLAPHVRALNASQLRALVALHIVAAWAIVLLRLDTITGLAIALAAGLTSNLVSARLAHASRGADQSSSN